MEVVAVLIDVAVVMRTVLVVMVVVVMIGGVEM